MDEPNFNIKTREEIDAQLEKALLAQALFELRERELDALAQAAAVDEHAAQLSLAHRPAIHALIAKRLRRTRRQRVTRHVLPRVGMCAAGLLLACYLGMTAVVLAEPQVGIRMMQLLLDTRPEYTQISLVENEDAGFFVPEEWLGDYYPAYVPEGFVLDDAYSLGSTLYQATYRNTKDMFFTFIEGTENSQSNIDTEDAVIDTVIVNGKIGMLSDEDGFIFITWSDYDRYFVVGLDGTREEAIEIAESVTRIR